MQPIDNSDLAWLIIADFLADQNKVTESEELRDSITNPDTEGWNYEYRVPNRVGGVGTHDVGGTSGSCVGVASRCVVCGVGTVVTVGNKVGSVGNLGVGSFGLLRL